MKRKKQTHFLLLAVVSSLVTQNSVAGVSYSSPLVGGETIQYTPVPRNANANSLFVDEQKKYDACNTPDLLQLKSQARLMKLFTNVACSSVGTFVSSDKLDINYCEAVNKCNSVESGDVDQTLDKATRDFLEQEAMDYLIRENVKQEMTKYTGRNALKFKTLLKYTDHLPPEFKSKINKCAGKELPAHDECIANSLWDSKTKFYMTEKSSGDVTNEVQGYEKGPLSGLEEKTSSTSSSSAALPDPHLANAVAALANNKTLAEAFASFSADDHLSIVDRSYNSLNPAEDMVLQTIKSDLTDATTGKLIVSPEEARKKVIDTIVKYTASRLVIKVDPIFKYRTSAQLETDLKSALENINFTAEDFAVNEKLVMKGLANKINSVRLTLANKYIADDCGQYSTSIGDVCSNLTNRLGSGRIVDVLSENKDTIFENIYDYYKNSNDRDRESKIALLKKIIDGKSGGYQKYLSFMIEKKACVEKFKGDLQNTDSKPTLTDLANKKRIDDEMEAAFKADREAKTRVVKDAISRNTNLQDDLRRAGLRTSDLKIESNRDTLSIASGGSLAGPAVNRGAESIIGAHSDDYITATKGLQDQTAMNTHPQQQVRNFDPIVDSTITTNAVGKAEEKKARDEEDDVNAQLRSRLAQLEGKEKSLSKKLSTSNEEDSDAKSSDELQSLRQQIEELKKLQTKNAKEREEAIARISDTPTVASNSSSNDNHELVVNSGSQNAHSQNTNGDSDAAVAASHSNTASTGNGGDYAANASGNAASHSASSSGSSGKGSSEKSGNGIVLTKTGETMIDPTSIMDNPNEKDIVSTLELGNGQPFLIRENGVLMKVSVELDSKGKPKVNNGKIVYKKTKLTKEQQRSVAQEVTNTQKAMKEVSNEPVRLYNLRSLLHDKVKAAQ